MYIYVCVCVYIYIYSTEHYVARQSRIQIGLRMEIRIYDTDTDVCPFWQVPSTKYWKHAAWSCNPEILAVSSTVARDQAEIKTQCNITVQTYVTPYPTGTGTIISGVQGSKCSLFTYLHPRTRDALLPLQRTIQEIVNTWGSFRPIFIAQSFVSQW